MTDVVLSVSDLAVTAGRVPLVRGVSFDLIRGERVGLIGESGSGKTVTALALAGLVAEGMRATGNVRLGEGGRDLVAASDRQLSRVRGRDIAMVFQEPMTALNPLMRVGDQVAEGMLVHGTQPSRRAARRAARAVLGRVGLPEPGQLARAYPHQLSGGQRQRVMLAIAIAASPSVLVCDEPTTALDVSVQQQVLSLIRQVADEEGAALLFITHELAVVALMCQRVMVMYGGRIVESGPVDAVLGAPRHPYTQGLVEASSLTVAAGTGRLATIAGTVPPAGEFPRGCSFRDRCAHADADCLAEPEFRVVAGHGVECFHPLQERR